MDPLNEDLVALMFGGIQKNSLIDYPGKVSCVLFFSGCNFHCPYCHNPDLARGRIRPGEAVDEESAFAFLVKRRGLVDAVVLSGGEASLSPHLPRICGSLKGLGFSVKLDTNGSRPRVLEALIDQGLVDYVAMDIKTAPEAYSPDFCAADRSREIGASIDLLLAAGIPYEFRTTCAAPLVNEQVIEAMARRIAGAKRYVLQPCLASNGLDPTFFEAHPDQPSREDLAAFQGIAAPFVGNCFIA